jgi:hypothetical protein
MMMNDDESGAVGGMIDGENRSTRQKPASVPLCPPQIPHDLTRDRYRIAAVGSQQLIALATARLKTSAHFYQTVPCYIAEQDKITLQDYANICHLNFSVIYVWSASNKFYPSAFPFLLSSEVLHCNVCMEGLIILHSKGLVSHSKWQKWIENAWERNAEHRICI